MSKNHLNQMPVGELMDRVKAAMKRWEISMEDAAVVAICEINAEADALEESSLHKQDLSPIWTQLGIDTLPDKFPEGPLAKKR